MITLSKKEFRQLVKKEFLKFSIDYLKNNSEKNCRKLIDFLQTNKNHYSNNIISYMPIKYEVDVSLFNNYILNSAEYKLLVPKIIDSQKIEVFEINKSTKYETNKYGILEPSDVLLENKEYKDIELTKKIIIICPGLAFDLSGNRLGRGAGYYDNFFESNNAERFYKIGVCFDFMMFDALPSNLRDVKMDCIIMPEKIINI